MASRKTLKPTNQARAKREKLALAMAKTDRAIKEQEGVIKRLNDNIDRWILARNAMEYTRDIAIHYRAQLQREFDQG